MTMTVADTAAQPPDTATATNTFAATSMQCTAVSQCNAVGPAARSTPASCQLFFSSYKDTGVNMNPNTDQVMTDVLGWAELASVAAINVGLSALTFGFAVGEYGSENRGEIDGAAFAEANIADWSNVGLKFMLSAGGGTENGLFTCGSDVGMETFLNRYASSQLQGVDFAVMEGQEQSVINDLVVRVQASQSAHPNLRFSFSFYTLGGLGPVALGQDGQNTMSAIQNTSLTDYYINLWSADYGIPDEPTCTLANGACDMGAWAIAAATNLNNEYNVPYDQIELTVMIGGNDAPGETFTLSNVDTVSEFILQNGLVGLHFWSLDRDVDCLGDPGARCLTAIPTGPLVHSALRKGSSPMACDLTHCWARKLFAGALGIDFFFLVLEQSAFFYPMLFCCYPNWLNVVIYTFRLPHISRGYWYSLQLRWQSGSEMESCLGSI